MTAKLCDVLLHKEQGDKWYSYLAPEEYHFWNLHSQWEPSKFRKYQTQILALSIGAEMTVPGTRNIQKFRSKDPLYLECGIEVTKGKIETKQKKYARATLRVDSVYEFNEAMKEFSKIAKINIWEIKQIQTSNKKTGGICTFLRHNPDGNGTNLYFYRLDLPIEKRSILYPDVSISDQEHYLGKFKQYFAACVCTEQLQKFHGCVLQKKKKPIKK
jgi:hypothetical protein